MKKDPFQHNSRLAFRSAATAAVFVGLSCGIAVFFFFRSGVGLAVLFGLGTIIVAFAAVYTVIYILQFWRLKQLNQIIRNIARKQFEDYKSFNQHGADELDYLIKQAIRASRTIEREIQRLNRIENYRKEFIGDISHELKTPIFAIQGFIETLLNGAIEDDEVNRKFLKKAMRNVDRLTYLTKDLMEISKLETGELKSEIEDVYLYDVVSDVIENLQYKADQEDIEIIFNEFDKNILVSADRNQIKQALINLIENSIKYNKPSGSVTVGVKSYPEDEDRLLVYVKDTGIGMEQQHIDRVTERFFRIDKSRSRDKGGTGLGLSIVKHIMEAHDEEFFIESTPNVGSKFSFTLSKVERTAVSV
ncbi:MAG TPA: ATP-binding protein [Balneolaceae bacterium]|nr:ATP-binding protein [Balneolaceae bacterium]